MREEIATSIRYSPILRREVVVRLTYAVGEGPRPDIIRWFLVKEEVQRLQESAFDRTDDHDFVISLDRNPNLREG